MDGKLASWNDLFEKNENHQSRPSWSCLSERSHCLRECMYVRVRVYDSYTSAHDCMRACVQHSICADRRTTSNGRESFKYVFRCMISPGWTIQVTCQTSINFWSSTFVFGGAIFIRCVDVFDEFASCRRFFTLRVYSHVPLDKGWNTFSLFMQECQAANSSK